MQTASRHVLFVDPREFSFVAKGQDSGILREAFDRRTPDLPVLPTVDLDLAVNGPDCRDACHHSCMRQPPGAFLFAVPATPCS